MYICMNVFDAKISVLTRVLAETAAGRCRRWVVDRTSAFFGLLTAHVCVKIIEAKTVQVPYSAFWKSKCDAR